MTSAGHHLIGADFQKRPTTAVRKNKPATPARNGITTLPDCPGSPSTKSTIGLESAANGQSNPAFPAAAGAKAVRLYRAPSRRRMNTTQRTVCSPLALVYRALLSSSESSVRSKCEHRFVHCLQHYLPSGISFSSGMGASRNAPIIETSQSLRFTSVM